MKSEKPTNSGRLRQLAQRPKNWYLRFFYYNPKDKRLLPSKKIEWMGYTINFANPYSVLLLSPLVIIIVLILSK